MAILTPGIPPISQSIRNQSLDSDSELTILGNDRLDGQVGHPTLLQHGQLSFPNIRSSAVATDPLQISPMFRIDVSADPNRTPGSNLNNVGEATLALLHQMVMAQQRQNQLLEQLVNTSINAQKQRNNELQQWKDANPQLADSCRRAAEVLSKVQSEFLEQLTQEIEEQEEDLMDGEYVLNEFVDRFGPRLAHLNGVLQVLAQLSAAPAQ